jgi:uncharacterized membrane protein AbrB (regulator of aidB expression)
MSVLLVIFLGLTLCFFRGQVLSRVTVIYHFTFIISHFPGTRYIVGVSLLTKQEQMVLCLIFVLLLTGWAVKTWRTAHPAAAVPLVQKS